MSSEETSYSKISIGGRTFKHLFGPVISRRLGVSLGVDMIPFKTCTLDCVYCECGATNRLSAEIKPWISAQEIIEELDTYLGLNPKIDVITFAGSGEPTLNSDLNKVIAHVKNRWSSFKTVLITNGTLLYKPQVRAAAIECDFVLPSLDAISEDVFRKINGPVSSISSKMVIDGLLEFAKEYRGQLWLEIFVLEGVNDTESELAGFREVLSRINPQRVQLNSLDRPGTCNWVKPASRERLEEIATYLSPLNVEIVARK